MLGVQPFCGIVDQPDWMMQINSPRDEVLNEFVRGLRIKSSCEDSFHRRYSQLPYLFRHFRYSANASSALNSEGNQAANKAMLAKGSNPNSKSAAKLKRRNGNAA